MTIASFDTTTAANITKARTLRGQVPTQYRVPFRNIRDVLGLHTKVNASKPYLIYYDGDNNRKQCLLIHE